MHPVNLSTRSKPTTVGRALTNSLHGCRESEVGIKKTTSEVTSACSDDCATWLLLCRIKQPYTKSLNSLALTCTSLYFLLQFSRKDSDRHGIMFTRYVGCFPNSAFSQISRHLARIYDVILIRKRFVILLLSYFLKSYSYNQKI